MANVIKTVLTYQLDGSNRDFNIPFEYLARKFVVVTLIGVDRKVLTLNTDYRFATRTTISLTKAWGPADGYTTIELRRVTSTTDRLVDFTDGSILRAYDLNVAQIQTMHVAEEARDLTADTIGVNNDGHLDARGRRIVNLANAVDDRDAVPFGQLKTMNQNAWDAQNKAKQYRDEAEQFKNTSKEQAGISTTKRNESERFRNEALQFRNEAEQFKTQAGNSQTAARNSEVNAKTSETNAKTSEGNALAHANRAKSEADRAKTEADKLDNWNALAGTIEEVTDEHIKFNRTIRTQKGFVAQQADGLRITYKNFGVIFRNDGGSMYTLVTNEGDPEGTWGSLRPHRIDLRTGRVWMENGVTVRGGGIDTDRMVVNSGSVYAKSSYGSGGFANQLNDSAPFSVRIPGDNQDSNVYYPIIKQFGRRSDGYPISFSMGLESKGTGAFHDLWIQLLGDNNKKAMYRYTINGDFTAPKGVYAEAFFTAAGGMVSHDGNLKGSVWGGKWIKQWIEENTVKQIKMGSLQTSTLFRAKGVSDGGGKVVTGVVNHNSDDLPDNVQWRVMQYVRPNGSAYNIY